MNLARPPFLHDSEIETDLLRPPNAKEEVVDNFRIYIELAKIQSRIITDLRPAKGSDREAGLMSEILVKMDLIWRLNEEVRFPDTYFSDVTNSSTGTKRKSENDGGKIRYRIGIYHGRFRVLLFEDSGFPF